MKQYTSRDYTLDFIYLYTFHFIFHIHIHIGTNSYLGWFIGEANSDCDVTCAAHGLICTEDGMWNHNSDVNSPEKLTKLINSLQGETSFNLCSGKYGDSPDVPLFSTSEGFCYSSSPGKSKEKIECGLSPTPQYQNKKRLCYCHAGKSKRIRKQ